MNIELIIQLISLTIIVILGPAIIALLFIRQGNL
uniref:Photosystem II reaction center protein Psb30 n=1 Tax=Trachelomonas grandis TaxID=215769 RepID=A0A385UK58_9EUGL|nr:photosystem II reaction center protein [Trachelomonas grandis]